MTMMLRWVSTKLGLARAQPQRRGRRDGRAFADTLPAELAADDLPAVARSSWLESSMLLHEGLEVVEDAEVGLEPVPR